MAFLVNLEELVDQDHPLREVKRMCQEVLDVTDRATLPELQTRHGIHTDRN